VKQTEVAVRTLDELKESGSEVEVSVRPTYILGYMIENARLALRTVGLKSSTPKRELPSVKAWI
jgi:hypothetical protein